MYNLRYAHAQFGLRFEIASVMNSHLTSGASVRPENSVTYSTGNEGQEICGDFSETAPLQGHTASCVVGYFSDIPRTFFDGRAGSTILYRPVRRLLKG